MIDLSFMFCRLAKEKVYYEKEADELQVKVDKMKSDGKDEYDIRKMEEVMAESKMMIPDCERKLAAARKDLIKLLETEKDLEESEEYKKAQAIIEDTQS
ncbi:hypothetical protein LSH36_746g01093 [Paralvinella palmiformis]|uniref:Tubulin-specific chaperone A n=1 Tax=Paralvinella palmiformis TaxID=53620 RepID=A0AAD9J0Z5_9ANNE|nr:hypothetical protein LSH36_746g01093 [Paralvinella palmiformis]